MIKYGRLEIEVHKEPFPTSDGNYSVVVWHMTPTYDARVAYDARDGVENGSGTSFVPRFQHRRTAKWVAERIFDAYKMDGWDVKWRKRK